MNFTVGANTNYSPRPQLSNNFKPSSNKQHSENKELFANKIFDSFDFAKDNKATNSIKNSTPAIKEVKKQEAVETSATVAIKEESIETSATIASASSDTETSATLAFGSLTHASGNFASSSASISTTNTVNV